MNKTWQAGFSALAALICAASVAMSAYASHGLEGDAQRRLLTASYFAFAHGLALIVLCRRFFGKSHFLACGLMLTGIILFCGSLASAALWQTSTPLAPAGGMSLILAWCWVAINFFILKEE